MAEYAKRGPPTPRLSSPSNPLALPPNPSPTDIRKPGAAIRSPQPSLAAASGKTASSSGGRGGSSSHQLNPQAPPFTAGARSFGHYSGPVASDISSATRAFGEVTLGDAQVAKGHSGMISSNTMNAQLIIVGYVSWLQGAQRNPAPSTNVQYQPEFISDGAHFERRKINSLTSRVITDVDECEQITENSHEPHWTCLVN